MALASGNPFSEDSCRLRALYAASTFCCVVATVEVTPNGCARVYENKNRIRRTS